MTAYDAGLTIRSAGSGELRLSGIACRTEVPYDMGGYIEVVKRNAFKRTLGEKPDVQLLINHVGLPLARTRSGTLQLEENELGLAFDASLDREDPDVQSLTRKMERGDIDGASFAFQVSEQSWSDDCSQRTIKQVTIHRGDISVCNQGANPAAFATVSERSALTAEQRRRRADRLGTAMRGFGAVIVASGSPVVDTRSLDRARRDLQLLQLRDMSPERRPRPSRSAARLAQQRAELEELNRRR